jgi:hypothetical protein
MKLQSWRNKENLPAVGLAVVFFFMPYLVAGRKPPKPTFFCTSTLNPMGQQ